MRHLEIERKFLVRKEIWNGLVKSGERHLRQGYLCRNDQSVVRVRTASGKGYLTIKGKLENLGRSEFEYQIPLEDAEELLAMVQGHVIEKTRYKIMHRGKSWDVDVFHGLNQGLFLAELELDHPAEEVDLPEWAGEEVSHDLRYYNAYLAEHPYSTWTHK